MVRRAECCCRSSYIEVEGDPAGSGICHCDNCKRRTGSAFGWSVYFPDASVRGTGGSLTDYQAKADQVRTFCTACGTTLFWKAGGLFKGMVGIAGGTFCDDRPRPSVVAQDDHGVDWVQVPEDWSRIQMG